MAKAGVAKARAGAAKRKVAPKKVFDGNKAAAKTLVQKREADMMRNTRKRTLKARKTDDVVDKILSDNFKNWRSRVDTVFKGGVNVRQVLQRDVRRRRQKEVCMGKLYYANLKETFGDADSAISAVWASDESEPVDGQLKLALLALKGSKSSNPQPLLNWLQQDGPKSERSVVAVMKAALDLQPRRHIKQCTLVIEVLRWLVRNNFHTLHQANFDICKSHFDNALARHLEFQQGEGLTMDEWWELNSPIAKQIVDGPKFEACLRCETNWSSLEPVLRVVVLSSELGRVAFETDFNEVLSEKNTDMVSASIGRLATGDLTEEKVKNARDQFIKDCHDSGKDAFGAFACRQLEVVYRGPQCRCRRTR